MTLNFVRLGEGEPLVLLHPLGAELVVWEPVMPLLAPSRDVIAPDMPGFGRSSELPEDEEATPAALARAVATLMDELGIESAHVAGVSLGGWVATAVNWSPTGPSSSGGSGAVARSPG